MPQNPMYRSIADDLRTKIQDGTLAPNAKLPTESELSDQYNASRNTVREAIRRLTDEGLLESRPGQGTFVLRKVVPFVTVLSAPPEVGFGGGEAAAYKNEVENNHREPDITTPRVEVPKATPDVAELLEIAPGSSVVSREQDRFIDGVLWSRQTTFYLMDYVTKGASELLMAADIEHGAVAYLAKKIGIRQKSYRDWIKGRLATDQEQELFGIGHQAVVFVHSRVAFDQAKTPMRLTVTIFPVDRNQLVYNVGTEAPSLGPGDPDSEQ
jgi:GntR family transcriptional regulator